MRLISNYRELLDAKEESSITLKMALADATQYIELLKQTTSVREGSPEKKIENDDDAENIQICDDELSQMFGKGDF